MIMDGLVLEDRRHRRRVEPPLSDGLKQLAVLPLDSQFAVHPIRLPAIDALGFGLRRHGLVLL